MRLNSLSIRRFLPFVLAGATAIGTISCLKEKDSTSDQYKEWRETNEAYVLNAEDSVDDTGNAFYERLVPSWAPEAYVLIHWYNDRSQTANNLSPMDNSTVKITYELFNINGDTLATSFAAADSVYTSKPNNNIIGVWASLTQMHVGDSVRLVIPYKAGYGDVSYGGIPPYSTLIYNVKLKAITAYEVE